MVELDFFYFVLTLEIFTPEFRTFLRMLRNLFAQAEFWRVPRFPLCLMQGIIYCGKRSMEWIWNVPGSGPGWLRGLWWFVLPKDFVSSAEHTRGLHHLFLIKAEEWIRTHFRGRSGRCEAHIDIKKRNKKKKTQQNWVYCTTLVSALIMVLNKRLMCSLGNTGLAGPCTQGWPQNLAPAPGPITDFWCDFEQSNFAV